MNIQEYTPAHAAAWDAFVDRHAEAPVFHRAGWKPAIERSMQFPGHYLMAMDQGQVIGIYPFFILATRLFGTLGVSLPYLSYGGVVADTAEAEQALLAAAEQIARAAGCEYLELRQLHPLQTALPTTDRKVVSEISLADGPDAVFQRLHQNVRNKIRKAQKNAVTVQQGAEYLEDFYRIYCRNLRDLGTPVISGRFFAAMLAELPRQVRIYRAQRLGRTIAAKAALVDNGVCYFTWSASLREELGHAPVQAMNWRAIEEACAAGCTRIDFGTSTAGTSGHEFKKYWGGETRTLPWAYQLLDRATLPALNKENRKFALAIALWKRLPLAVSKVIGPPLGRCLP